MLGMCTYYGLTGRRGIIAILHEVLASRAVLIFTLAEAPSPAPKFSDYQ